MDDATAKKFRDKAIKQMNRLGLGRDAEDIAQDVLLHWMTKDWRGKGQAVNLAVIDSLRRNMGDKRSKGYDVRRALIAVTPVDDFAFLRKQAAENTDPMEGFDDAKFVNRVLSKLETLERASLLLDVVWGFKHHEIARLFGVSNARVSQHVSNSRKKLQRLFKNEVP